MSEPVIALDTNALMMPIEADLDPFDELERLLGRVDPVVPQAVRGELASLGATGSSEEARAARLGEQLADERCRPMNHERDRADDALVELAEQGRIDYAVTNDAPLRERLHAVGLPVISLRGQNTLAVIHP